MTDTQRDNQQREKIRDAMIRRDLLGNHDFSQTHLFASFAAIRASFRKFFRIKEIPFVHNNDVKQMLRAKLEPSYPYAYVSMNSMSKTEAHLNGNTVRRRGVGHVLDGSNSTLTRLHYFPVTLRYEFHYVTNDYFDAIRFIGEALILFDSKVLNVQVTTGNVTGKLTIKADTTEVQIPRADKDNEAEPEAFDLVIACSSDTWTGIEKKISKVNNEGAVTFHAVVVNPDGTVVDEETTVLTTADDV